MVKNLSQTSPSTDENVFSLLRGDPFCPADSPGFTLVELIVILAIVAVVGALALPDFSEWQSNAKAKAVARDVVTHLQLARMEAAKANGRAVVLFTSGAYSPSGQVGNYTIFMDNNQNFVQDGGDRLIVQQGMPARISLYTADFADFAGLGAPGTASGFRARGLPLSSADGTANAGISIRNHRSRFYRVLLSPAGNIRLQTSRDGASWQ